jgi:hypothetical protein
VGPPPNTIFPDTGAFPLPGRPDPSPSTAPDPLLLARETPDADRSIGTNVFPEPMRARGTGADGPADFPSRRRAEPAKARNAGSSAGASGSGSAAAFPVDVPV